MLRRNGFSQPRTKEKMTNMKHISFCTIGFQNRILKFKLCKYLACFMLPVSNNKKLAKEKWTTDSNKSKNPTDEDRKSNGKRGSLQTYCVGKAIWHPCSTSSSAQGNNHITQWLHELSEWHHSLPQLLLSDLTWFKSQRATSGTQAFTIYKTFAQNITSSRGFLELWKQWFFRHYIISYYVVFYTILNYTNQNTQNKENIEHNYTNNIVKSDSVSHLLWGQLQGSFPYNSLQKC